MLISIEVPSEDGLGVRVAPGLYLPTPRRQPAGPWKLRGSRPRGGGGRPGTPDRGCILTSTRRHPPCREVTLRTRGLSHCISGSCVGGTSGTSPLQGGEWASVAFAFPCPWPEAQGPHEGVCLGAQAGSARCLLWGGMAGDGPLCEPAEGRAVWAAWSPLSYCRSPGDSRGAALGALLGRTHQVPAVSVSQAVGGSHYWGCFPTLLLANGSSLGEKVSLPEIKREAV